MISVRRLVGRILYFVANVGNAPFLRISERHHPLVARGERRVGKARLNDRGAGARQCANREYDRQNQNVRLHARPAQFDGNRSVPLEFSMTQRPLGRDGERPASVKPFRHARFALYLKETRLVQPIDFCAQRSLSILCEHPIEAAHSRVEPEADSDHFAMIARRMGDSNGRVAPLLSARERWAGRRRRLARGRPRAPVAARVWQSGESALI